MIPWITISILLAATLFIIVGGVKYFIHLDDKYLAELEKEKNDKHKT